VRAPWPPGFPRIPDEDWTRTPLEELALGYDTVEQHGWYRNLDPTVDQAADLLRPGDILIDYSGGTGIFTERLLRRLGQFDCGILIVDSSEKFLRLALEKFRNEPRVALRHIRYLKDEARIQRMQEVVEPALLKRGADLLVSTNAVHLYYDLHETFTSWHDALRPAGTALVQSGNIGVPAKGDDVWIIDETVHAIDKEARRIVQEDDQWAPYRSVLEDAKKMAEYDRLRNKFFLPVRPLSHYLGHLEDARLNVKDVRHETIPAKIAQWYEFLRVYHEGILGWIGGSRRIEGQDPPHQAIQDRQLLMQQALGRLFEGNDHFQAIWTYITAQRNPE
jgi:SAM-dependent methyltransferase